MAKIQSLLSSVSSAIDETLAEMLSPLKRLAPALLLLCLLACVDTSIIGHVVAGLQESALASAASKLGCEPSFDGLAGYINASVEPGMTREQVERILAEIGTVKVDRGDTQDSSAGWGPLACDDISIKMLAEIPGLGTVPGTTFPRMIACYDAKGGLVRLSPFHVSDAPPVGVSAPRVH